MMKMMLSLVKIWTGFFVCILHAATATATATTRGGLATSAATNFKSNYEGTSVLKGLTPTSGSSSNYYNQQQQQQQQQQYGGLKYYFNSGELANIVNNESALKHEAESEFVVNDIIANNNNYKRYNNNNNNYNNIQNMLYNNIDNNNNNDNNYYKVYVKSPIDEIDYGINNDNYHIAAVSDDPVTTRTITAAQNTQIHNNNLQNLHVGRNTAIAGLMHEFDYKVGPNYFPFQQEQQEQPEQQTAYLHNYESEQFNDYYQQQMPRETYKNNELRVQLLQPTTTTKTIRDTAPASGENIKHIESNSYAEMPPGNNVKTNYNQQHTLIPIQTKTTTTRRKEVADFLSSDNDSYYKQLYNVSPLRAPINTHTTIRHNALSEAALRDIPLERHVAVEKHLPTMVYHKRLFVPHNQSVHIEVPQTIINAERKPLPIQVPQLQKTITVREDMRELRIPIEKFKPFAVEKAMPYVVERRTPYRVERQVAVPYFYPYPIRVPMVKTVLHKIPTHAYRQHHFGN